jgi:peptide chain release factor 1
MKDTIRQRLEKQVDRYEEVGRLLAAPDIDGSSNQFRELSMEYSRLTPMAERFEAYRRCEAELRAAGGWVKKKFDASSRCSAVSSWSCADH